MTHQRRDDEGSPRAAAGAGPLGDSLWDEVADGAASVLVVTSAETPLVETVADLWAAACPAREDVDGLPRRALVTYLPTAPVRLLEEIAAAAATCGADADTWRLDVVPREHREVLGDAPTSDLLDPLVKRRVAEILAVYRVAEADPGATARHAAALVRDAAARGVSVAVVNMCPSAVLEAMPPQEREAFCAPYARVLRPAPGGTWERVETWREACVPRRVVLDVASADDAGLRAAFAAVAAGTPVPASEGGVLASPPWYLPARATREGHPPDGNTVDAETALLALLASPDPTIAVLLGVEGAGKTTLLRRVVARTLGDAGEGLLVVPLPDPAWGTPVAATDAPADAALGLARARVAALCGGDARDALDGLRRRRRVAFAFDGVEAVLDPRCPARAERFAETLAALVAEGFPVVVASAPPEALDAERRPLLERFLARLRTDKGRDGIGVLRLCPLDAAARGALVARFVQAQADACVIGRALVAGHTAAVEGWFAAAPGAEALASTPAWVVLAAATVVAGGPSLPRQPGRRVSVAWLIDRFLLDVAPWLDPDPRALLHALEDVTATAVARRMGVQGRVAPEDSDARLARLRGIALVGLDPAAPTASLRFWHEAVERRVLRNWVARVIVRPLRQKVAALLPGDAAQRAFAPPTLSRIAVAATAHEGQARPDVDAVAQLLKLLDPALVPMMQIVLGDAGAGKTTLLRHVLRAWTEGQIGGGDVALVPLLDLMNDWPARADTPAEATRLADEHLARLLGAEAPAGALALLLATHRVLVIADGFPHAVVDANRERVNLAACALAELTRATGASVIVASLPQLEDAPNGDLAQKLAQKIDDGCVVARAILVPAPQARLIATLLEVRCPAATPEARAALTEWLTALPAHEPVCALPWWIALAADALARDGFSEGFPPPDQRAPHRVIIDAYLRGRAAAENKPAPDTVQRANARLSKLAREGVTVSASAAGSGDRGGLYRWLVGIGLLREEAASPGGERWAFLAVKDLRGVYLARSFIEDFRNLYFDPDDRLCWPAVRDVSRKFRCGISREEIQSFERQLARDPAVPAEEPHKYAPIIAHVTLVHHLYNPTPPDGAFLWWSEMRFRAYMKRLEKGAVRAPHEWLMHLGTVRELGVLLDRYGSARDGANSRVAALTKFVDGSAVAQETLTNVLVGFYGSARPALLDLANHLRVAEHQRHGRERDRYRELRLLNVLELRLLIDRMSRAAPQDGRLQPADAERVSRAVAEYSSFCATDALAQRLCNDCQAALVRAFIERESAPEQDRQEVPPEGRQRAAREVEHLVEHLRARVA